MMAEHGWMAGAGYTFSHVYYITIMKENVKIGQQTPGHKQIAVRPEDPAPENSMAIPSDMVKPQILEVSPQNNPGSVHNIGSVHIQCSKHKPSSEHIPCSEKIPGSEHIPGSEQILASEKVPGSDHIPAS